MKKSFFSGIAIGLFLSLGVAAWAQSLLPVPSGIWSAGQIVTAVDANNAGVAPAGFGSQIKVYSQTITPAEVATVVCAEQTFTVTGLTTDDKVLYNPPATGNATSAAQARVSAADTLAVMYCNPTAGALTPGAGTGVIVAIRSS